MKPEQITAWALNEASAEDRQQLEAALLENSQDKQKAEETKAFCDFLLSELRDDSLALTDKQRERLVAHASQPVEQSSRLPSASETLAPPTSRKPQTKWRIGIIVRLAVAACVALGGFWTWQQLSPPKVVPQVVAVPEPGVKVQHASKPEAKRKVGQGPESRLMAEIPRKVLVPAEPQPTKSLAPMPAPSSVAAAPALVLKKSLSTMTPRDTEKLKQIQDQNAYALNFDGKMEKLAVAPAAAPAASVSAVLAPSPAVAPLSANTLVANGCVGSSGALHLAVNTLAATGSLNIGMLNLETPIDLADARACERLAEIDGFINLRGALICITDSTFTVSGSGYIPNYYPMVSPQKSGMAPCFPGVQFLGANGWPFMLTLRSDLILTSGEITKENSLAGYRFGLDIGDSLLLARSRSTPLVGIYMNRESPSLALVLSAADGSTGSIRARSGAAMIEMMRRRLVESGGAAFLSPGANEFPCGGLLGFPEWMPHTAYANANSPGTISFDAAPAYSLISQLAGGFVSGWEMPWEGPLVRTALAHAGSSVVPMRGAIVTTKSGTMATMMGAQEFVYPGGGWSESGAQIDWPVLTVGQAVSGTAINGKTEAAEALVLASDVTEFEGFLNLGDPLKSSAASSTLARKAVAKSDAGAWTLSGANTYTGATTINAGVLKIDARSEATPALAAPAVAGMSPTISPTMPRDDFSTTSVSFGYSFTQNMGQLGNGGGVPPSANYGMNDIQQLHLWANTNTAPVNLDSSTIHDLNGAAQVAADAPASATFGKAASSSPGNTSGGATSSLSKLGTGNLPPSDSTTYTGTTTINGGTLALGAAPTPASPPVAVIGGWATTDGKELATLNSFAPGVRNPLAAAGANAIAAAPQAEATGKVQSGLLLGNGSAEVGNYDTAIAQYQEVLRTDPYNEAARRGIVAAEKMRLGYFKTAYDNHRAKMLAQVAEPWEDKVSKDAKTDAFYLGTNVMHEERKAESKSQPSVGESYTRIIENEMKDVAREPLSTLSIDVDTASYANVRRFLNQNMIPPPDAVRIEELVNYFPTSEEGPAHEAREPFAVRVELAPCPWQPVHRLARIAIKGREMDKNRKPSNLVFLVDVSGSMNEPAKLPLVQQSLRMLTAQLGEGDRVTMVVYAGSSGVVLPPTNGEKKAEILAAIDRLSAGGSTHGSAGIKLAYEQAVAGFIKGGVNRVILCTDGDFNVGVSSPEELEKLIKHKAKTGVFLSVLGFGSGNLQDRTMETLADKGNGNYAYIDSLSEARKVLVEQMGSTLETIAKDVKIQVEFNPAAVRSYRLIGYENRLLAKEDFNDDTKDAGEIGSGHSVVALYEIVPASLPPGTEPRPAVDSLKYQAPAISPAQLAEAANSGEMMTVKLRYKEPDSDLSKLIEVPTKDAGKTLTASSEEFKFSAAVAGFGLLLRDSAYQGTLSWETVRRLALDGKGSDKLGYRGEFLQLIDKARGLK